ncbi:FAD/NAD(P)-binding domain-containing protein [Auricularia subglabra TFB-10046 SS5]|nr:FAD/NAD(P)-binding domain-containing protein [Auricularia subglabra TFB-10046 SS5]
MTLPDFTEVIIVGAGPAGLACALVLASKGIPFVLLDALQEGQNQSRACVVHAYTLELLETLGISDALVDGGIQMQDMVALNEHDREISRVNISRALAPHTKYPYALLIAQCDVEAVLRQRLADLGGAIHWQTRVARLDDAEDGLGVALESGQTVRTKYVVAADGSKSIVRTDAGIPFVNPHTNKPSVATDADLQLVLADLHIAEPLPPALPTNRLWSRMDGNGVTLLIPLKSSLAHPAPANTHLFRIAASVPPNSAPHTPDEAYIQRLLDARGPSGAVHVADISTGSRYRARSGIAAQFHRRMPRSGRWVLLAGDAAHIHSPAGGQGMNLALCDGVMLGRALAAEHSEDAFDKYAQTRRAAALAVIGLAESLTSMFASGLTWRWLIGFALRLAQAIPGVQSMIAWRMSGLVCREN